MLSDETVSIEELLKSIYDDKLLIEKEKEKILKNSNQIELLRKQLENQNFEFENKKNDIINKAKAEAKSILISAKEDANVIIKDLNDLYDNANKDSLKKANSLRNKLNESIKNNVTIEDNIDDSSKPEDINISIGLEVLVKPFNMIGTVLTMPNKSNEVLIQFGNTRTNISVNNLQLPQSKDMQSSLSNNHNGKYNSHSNSTKKKSTSTSNLKSRTISTEINVIGKNVEEAIFVIDKYLDDCFLANLTNVTIVHGKGTGKLRDGIHRYLKKNPHVQSFRLGTFGEGEMGVTIVELKK